MGSSTNRRTDKPPVVRCSSLPRFMACVNSVMNPDDLLPVERHWEASDFGTAVHKLASDYVMTRAYDLEELRGRFPDADVDRGAQMMSYVMEFAGQLFDLVGATSGLSTSGTLTCEREVSAKLDGIILLGHVDIVVLPEEKGEPLRIVDWKTGRLKENHYHQMMGYAVCMWLMRGRIDKLVEVAVVYLEDGDVTMYAFTPTQMTGWIKEVEGKAKERRYVVNDKCVNCPLYTACPAYEQVRKTALTVLGQPPKKIRKMNDKERAKLFLQLKTVDRSHGILRGALKDEARRNGPIPTGDGREYAVVEREERELDSAIAVPILLKHLTEEELFSAMHIPLTDVVNAATKRAKPGQKSKARAALLKALDKAGAIKRIVSERLETRTIKESDNGDEG